MCEIPGSFQKSLGFDPKIWLCWRIKEKILHTVKIGRKVNFQTPVNKLKVWSLFWDLYVLPYSLFSQVTLKSVLVSADKSPSSKKKGEIYTDDETQNWVPGFQDRTEPEHKDKCCPFHVPLSLGEQPPKTINWWTNLKPWPQGKRSLPHCLAVELSCPQWGSFLSKLPLLSLIFPLSEAFLDSSCSMWLETGMIKKGASDYSKTKKPEVVLFSLKEEAVVGCSLESCSLENFWACSGQRKAQDNEFRDHDHSIGQWEDAQLTDPDRQFCLSLELINRPQW